MFTMLREIPVRRLLSEQLPAFSGAFLLAETFYKFGSFTLEMVAFLATWFAIDAIIQLGRYLVGSKHAAGTE
jgi:hypothetical protein